MVNFISKPGMFFMGVQLNDYINSYVSCGMTPPRIIGVSDFAIRKKKIISNPNKDRLSVMNLGWPGPVAGQTITVKVKCRIPAHSFVYRICNSLGKYFLYLKVYVN